MTETVKMKKVGKVKEAHGLKGEVFVLIFSKDASWAQRLKFCGIKNPETQFKKKLNITRSKSHKDGLLILIEGFNNRNQAEEILGSDFYVSAELFISRKGEDIYLEEILNFKVLNGSQEVGEIQGFSSNGVQDILLIHREGFKNKVEILFVKDFIKQIDFENKILLMELPEGLIEVNE